MKILNAMQLKSGAKAEYNRMGSITQPIQFLPKKDKDDDWTAWNLDWLEWNGLKQIRRNARRLMKNYKLAKGIIDKTDYLVSEDNENRDLLETLTQEDTSALELKFYPIIPNVINVMVSEFAKRNTKITFKAVDEFSYNEQLEEKRQAIEEVLMSQAQQKLLNNMIEMGLDPNDPQVQEQMQQQMSPENLKSLPEIQDFFSKNYRSLGEQWAQHQFKVDEERFKMDELEERSFRDMLITDREFWHFRMMEDDYDIELWNPVMTFYHKSPEVRYISQGNWVGKIEMMTVADVIDKYGYLMTQQQLESLEAIYPVRSAGYPLQGYQNDGSYYDATKSHEWNTSMPSLAYRQFTSMYDNFIYNGGDIVNWVMGESEDYKDMGMAFMLRTTTAYWKSQRKVGHLTKITEAGEVIVDIIDESYKIIDKPIYNTALFKNKSKDNLIFGEHIEWIWINEVWGGVKIGPNHPSFWGMNNPGGINPMYLGIDQNRIGRLKFQFKGDNTLYGCKLPIEGSVFSDRNTRSTAMVDLMKPFQIGYNMVNNQIADILVDELGTVILLDQNALPRHSLGEDWGKNNLAKAYVAMKNFQMLPLDTSITNTENPLAFQHFQVMNLEQTQRMLSRIQMANYFKQQCFEVIGITPQRLGQQIGQTNTATGIEQAVAGSYAQTEMYFIQHSDYLMPRVHQMRTDLAQYYHSKKPSLRLQYMSTLDEKINFEINGTDLLLRDLNVFCSTKANHRAMVEQMKNLAVSNNTAGASIYDLGTIMSAESMAELTHSLKKIEDKTNNQRQEQMQHEQQMQQAELEQRAKEKQLELDHESMEKEKDRRVKLLEAEIKSAGYGSMQDINQNLQSDYVDQMDNIRKSDEFQQAMGLKQKVQSNKEMNSREKLAIEREKIQAQKDMKNTELQIAKENKNKYDVSKAKNDKQKKK
tara:strand:+ start:11138 stop:13912 length:2775 start_codon:yes stop_codon:yes gene_type:complete